MAGARRIDVFFYGLFMDPDLLRARGLEPAPVRVASVPGFALRVGRRAALVPATDHRAYGVVTQLSHDEIERLYADPSVQAYRPEGILVELEDGTRIAALCYNLAEPERAGNAEPSYGAKLRDLARRLKLPADYVAQIR
ncbi:MAG TPA: gamma-glutamylcyclotransferase family protein [Gemmatimonadaceae bacterium]|nr:gamma-glutamylcyclotransferase family protein [Gemmatimonadaceae bacterium]